MTHHLRVLVAMTVLSVAGMVAVVLADATPGTAASRTAATTHSHPPHPSPPPRARRRHHRPELYGITPRMMAMAERVSLCEEGGDWDHVGAVFDGGIGWTLANWAQFRRPTWPVHMHSAPPRMQANALFRFVRHYGMAMPDQDGGCAGY